VDLIPIKATEHDSAMMWPATAATGADHGNWRNSFCDSLHHGLRGVRDCVGMGRPPHTPPQSL